MITICIPIYNCIINPLVHTLHEQGENAGISFEILLIDDKSNQEICSQNEHISLPHCKYIPLSKNIGRSKIRNLFLQYAQFPYLLFLDCDSSIISPDYIKNYFDTINRSQDQVIYGGSIYPQEAPERDEYLRWKYGKLKESLSINERKKNPNRAFKTNNFMIQKDVFQENLFDETITGYGHEDTLFGFQLKNKNIPITHINNPVLNANNETNISYLKKTEEAIHNLVHIYKKTNYDPALVDEISLLHFYNKLKSKKLLNCVWFIFRIVRRPLYFILSKGYFFLAMFDFYKLGILINVYRSQNSI